jgi:hypothetical protein
MDGNVMRQFYGLGTLNMNANVGNRRYDSFQLSANKRFGSGFTLQFAYTLARLWTQTSSVGLYDYKWKDYSGFDDGGQRRHVANINYTYDVPGISRKSTGVRSASRTTSTLPSGGITPRHHVSARATASSM